MRSDLVVLPEPSIDNDLGLFGGEAVTVLLDIFGTSETLTSSLIA